MTSEVPLSARRASVTRMSSFTARCTVLLSLAALCEPGALRAQPVSHLRGGLQVNPGRSKLPPPVLDIDGNGVVGALTDGVLVARFLFGFTGDPLVAGAFNVDKCTRCEALAIEDRLAVLAAPSITQPLGEFQVNSFAVGDQRSASVAMGESLVIAWDSFQQDGSQQGVFARRFSVSGTRLGTEFQVNTYTPGFQFGPAVAFGVDGGFVIAWIQTRLFIRRFSKSGLALATEFKVNTQSSTREADAALDVDRTGNAVLAWTSRDQDGSENGIFARRFDANGDPDAPEFQVNTYTLGSQRIPSVAVDGDGAFMITWHSRAQDGSSYGVFARRFDVAGIPQAAEFQVNSYTMGSQAAAVIRPGANHFMVAWHDEGRDGSGSGVFARRFDAAGIPQAAEFQVNSYTTNSQSVPRMAIAGNDAVITWNSLGQDGSSHGIFAQRFSAPGERRGVEFQVNSYTAETQSGPGAVAMNGEGDFVVTWNSVRHHASDFDVFAQRFSTLALLDVDGNGTAAALTDGLLVLRFLLGFEGSSLLAGVVDSAGCTRCDEATIMAYLQSMV